MATTVRQPKPTKKGFPGDNPSNRRQPAWGGARPSPSFSPSPNNARLPNGPPPATSTQAVSFPPLGPSTPTPRQDHKLVLQNLAGLTGTAVTLLTKTAKRYEGVIASTTENEGDTTGVTLRDAKELTAPGAPVKSQLFIASTNIDSWSPASANSNSSAPPHSATNSRTDPKERTLLQTLAGLTGTTITFSTKTGERYEGVVASTAGERNVAGLTLRDVKELSAPGAPLNDQLIAAPDIDTWTSGPADAKVPNGDSFKTDTDISQKAPRRERELQAWQADLPQPAVGPAGPAHGHHAGHHTDDVTFGAGSSGNAGWNQFTTNEELFGVETGFDEELYTTKLDRSGAAVGPAGPAHGHHAGHHTDDVTFGAGSSGNAGWDQFATNEKLFGVKTTKLDRSNAEFAERERRAQALANEIMRSSVKSERYKRMSQRMTNNNPHTLEERVMNSIDDSGV